MPRASRYAAAAAVLAGSIAFSPAADAQVFAYPPPVIVPAPILYPYPYPRWVRPGWAYRPYYGRYAYYGGPRAAVWRGPHCTYAAGRGPYRAGAVRICR